MPIKTTDGGQTIGTYTMNMTVRETDVVGIVPAATVTPGPAGTYQLLSCAAAIPASVSTTTPCPVTKEVTLSAGQSASTLIAWVYATRNLDGVDETLAGWIVVKKWNGSSWANFASSWQGLAASSLIAPPVGSAVSPPQLFGTNSLAIRQEQWIDLGAEATEMTVIKNAGADLIRTNLPWGWLETNGKNGWDLAALAFFDQYFSMATSRGLKVIATFGTTPCWASIKANDTTICPTPQTPTGYPPANYNNLRDAATFVTNRWGYALYGIEVGNEPNHPNVQGIITPADYAAAVRTDYAAIKAANPAVLVGAGVLAGSDKPYLDSLYANGIQGYYDAISVHPYNIDFSVIPWVTASPLTLFSPYNAIYSFDLGMLNLRAFMLSKNDTKPMWITEFGFSTCQEGARPCVTEGQQAEWLTESFRMAARWPFVKVVMSFNGRDNDASLSWKSNWGMLDFDLSAKPSLESVSQTWECLRALTC